VSLRDRYQPGGIVGSAALPESESMLEEVSTTRSSGWASDQRAKLLLSSSANG